MRRRARHFLEGDRAKARDLLGDVSHESGLVGLAAMGHGRKVRRIGLDQHAIERHAARDRDGALAAVSDAMIDGIDVMGDAEHVRATVAAYAREGVEVPIVFPLPWGPDRAAVVEATLRAAAGAR